MASDATDLRGIAVFALLMVPWAGPRPAPAGRHRSSPPPPEPAAPPRPRSDSPGGADGPHAKATETTPPRVSYHPRRGLLLAAGRRRLGPAALNMPLAPGDVLYAGPAGNVEIQIGPRAFVRAAYGAQLGLDNQEPDFVAAPRHVRLCRARPARARAGAHGGARHARRGLHGGARRVLPRRGQAGHDHVPDASRRQPVMTPSAAPRHRWRRISRWSSPAAMRRASRRRAAGADRVGSLELPAHRLPDPARQREAGPRGRLRRGDARPARDLADGRELRQRVGAGGRGAGLVALHAPAAGSGIRASAGRGSTTRRGAGRRITTAAGSSSAATGRGRRARSSCGPSTRPRWWSSSAGRRRRGARVYWAPLGWGEPVIRWWGRPRYVGVAWWGGWGGPRVVNNVVINRTTTVNVTNINVYRNVNVTNAVVGVPADRFGQGRCARSAWRMPARRAGSPRCAARWTCGRSRPASPGARPRRHAAAGRDPRAAGGGDARARRHRAGAARAGPARRGGRDRAAAPAAHRARARARDAAGRERDADAGRGAPGPRGRPRRAAPDDDGQRDRARGGERGPRQTTPPDAGRGPAPARPTVTPPATSTPGAPAPSVAAPTPRPCRRRSQTAPPLRPRPPLARLRPRRLPDRRRLPPSRTRRPARGRPRPPSVHRAASRRARARPSAARPNAVARSAASAARAATANSAAPSAGIARAICLWGEVRKGAAPPPSQRMPARMKLCTNWRWKSRNATSSGPEVIRVAAVMMDQSTP